MSLKKKKKGRSFGPCSGSTGSHCGPLAAALLPWAADLQGTAPGIAQWFGLEGTPGGRFVQHPCSLPVLVVLLAVNSFLWCWWCSWAMLPAGLQCGVCQAGALRLRQVPPFHKHYWCFCSMPHQEGRFCCRDMVDLVWEVPVKSSLALKPGVGSERLPDSGSHSSMQWLASGAWGLSAAIPGLKTRVYVPCIRCRREWMLLSSLWRRNNRRKRAACRSEKSLQASPSCCSELYSWHASAAITCLAASPTSDASRGSVQESLSFESCLQFPPLSAEGACRAEYCLFLTLLGLRSLILSQSCWPGKQPWVLPTLTFSACWCGFWAVVVLFAALLAAVV